MGCKQEATKPTCVTISLCVCACVRNSVYIVHWLPKVCSHVHVPYPIMVIVTLAVCCASLAMVCDSAALAVCYARRLVHVDGCNGDDDDVVWSAYPPA